MCVSPRILPRSPCCPKKDVDGGYIVMYAYVHASGVFLGHGLQKNEDLPTPYSAISFQVLTLRGTSVFSVFGMISASRSLRYGPLGDHLAYGWASAPDPCLPPLPKNC